MRDRVCVTVSHLCGCDTVTVAASEVQADAIVTVIREGLRLATSEGTSHGIRQVAAYSRGVSRTCERHTRNRDACGCDPSDSDRATALCERGIHHCPDVPHTCGHKAPYPLAPCTHPRDTAGRVGYFLAWECPDCGRIENTGIDLLGRQR